MSAVGWVLLVDDWVGCGCEKREDIRQGLG